MLNWAFGRDQGGGGGGQAGANKASNGIGDASLRSSAQNPNYNRLMSNNRRYLEEMNRLDANPRQAESGGLRDGGGDGGVVGAAGTRREERTMMRHHRGDGDRGTPNDDDDGGGHGRRRGGHSYHAPMFAASSSAKAPPPPPLDNLDIRRDNITNVSGLTGIPSAREANRRREQRTRTDRGQEGSARKRSYSWSPGHYRSRSRSRRSRSIRKQRKHRRRSSCHGQRRRRRGDNGSSRNNSRSWSRERDRRSRREERRRRRRDHYRNNESPPSSPNSLGRRNNHREDNREERNGGGGNHSSPTYIVSEDSENYLIAVGAAVVDAACGGAAAAENSIIWSNDTPSRKSNGGNARGSSAARRGRRKRGDHSASKRSYRDDGGERHDGAGNKGRRHRRRSPSSEESSGGYSSNSHFSPTRRSRSSPSRREANDADLGNVAYDYNHESSYNPAPPGLQLGNHFSGREKGGLELAASHAPLFGHRSASHHDRFSDNHPRRDGDALTRSSRKRKGRKRSKRQRSLSKRSGNRRRSYSRSYSRGKRSDDATLSFSDSASSASPAYGRKRQRHESRCGRHDAGGRSRSPRSYGSRGRNTKQSKKSKKKSKKTHHHRRSNNHDAAGADEGGQSDSSRDDSVGHFRGGPGTMVGRHYRIIRDVGMGTFGRVVQCEELSQGSNIHKGEMRSNFRYGDDRHRVGDNLERYHQDYNRRAVAIKIVRNVRRYHDSALIEGDICERVNREQSRQRKDLCARMLDRFALPSGHYCLVFECLGRSLYDFLKAHDYRPFPLFCVRDFARKLLEALDFLHGFGLIHTDLKPENVLLTNDEETTYRSWDGSSCRIPASTAVKVIDFGGATYDDERKSSIVNTRQYRAPEVILGLGWSYPSDLWSVGCIIAELYAGGLLFATHDNAEHLALVERAVGPFPKELLDRTANSSGSSLVRECFDSHGWHKIRGVLSSRSIEHVRKMVPVEHMVLEHDRPTGLGRLLRSLLTIDPKRRATAREALMSPFFTQLG